MPDQDWFALVARLAAGDRAPFLELNCQGRTYQEVADDTGIPLGTLKRRLRSALDALRERLGRRSLSCFGRTCLRGSTPGAPGTG